jgi:hypothetical protein
MFVAIMATRCLQRKKRNLALPTRARESSKFNKALSLDHVLLEVLSQFHHSEA